MAHSCTLAVRGFHCDSYGHVNNARYLEFFEEARWDALEKDNLVSKFQSLGLQFFIANINMSFKKPVMANTIVEVRTSLKEVKRRTITFLQQIVKEGVVLTTVDITFVLFDVKHQKSATITPELENLFKSFKDNG